MSSTTFFADGIDGEVEFLQLQHLITEYVTAIQSMSVVLQIIDVDCQYRGNFVHVMDDDGAMPPSKRPRIHALPLEDVPRAPPRSAKLLFDEFYHRNPDPRAFRAMCRMSFQQFQLRLLVPSGYFKEGTGEADFDSENW